MFASLACFSWHSNWHAKIPQALYQVFTVQMGAPGAGRLGRAFCIIWEVALRSTSLEHLSFIAHCIIIWKESVNSIKLNISLLRRTWPRRTTQMDDSCYGKVFSLGNFKNAFKSSVNHSWKSQIINVSWLLYNTGSLGQHSGMTYRRVWGWMRRRFKREGIYLSVYGLPWWLRR